MQLTVDNCYDQLELVVATQGFGAAMDAAMTWVQEDVRGRLLQPGLQKWAMKHAAAISGWAGMDSVYGREDL